MYPVTRLQTFTDFVLDNNEEHWSNCGVLLEQLCRIKNGRLKCVPTPKLSGPGTTQEGLCSTNHGCPDGKRCCTDFDDKSCVLFVDEDSVRAESPPAFRRDDICLKKKKSQPLGQPSVSDSTSYQPSL